MALVENFKLARPEARVLLSARGYVVRAVHEEGVGEDYAFGGGIRLFSFHKWIIKIVFKGGNVHLDYGTASSKLGS